MKVAVTGASGFIGRHVVAELASRGIDTVLSSRDPERLASIPGRHETLAMDLSRATPRQLQLLADCDVLIHLAWNGLPNYRSAHHLEIELPVQCGFLKNLLASGLRALLVTGTCFEYGMQSGGLSEDSPALPENPYGQAKNQLRQFVEQVSAYHSVPLTWTRIFYTYGDDQASTSLYPQLKAAVERGDETFDMSGGEQWRDYLQVDDLAHLIVELALRRLNAGVVNVCSGRPVRVRDLVEGWIRENGWSIRPNLGRYPYPDYEPMAFWGIRQKLDSLLAQP